jgi:type IV pili sensor histidine kinase/response regulator
MPEPSQLDPLEAIVHLSFPRSTVQSVGDALAYLLLRSGYRLQAESFAQPVLNLLSMPLPEVHRRLGPFSVRSALTVLVGKPFAVSVDASHRVISFAGVEQSSAADAMAKTVTRPAGGAVQ